VSHFCGNWSHFLMLSVLPEFYASRFHIDYKSLGIDTMLPFAALFVTGMLAGPTCDRLIQGEMDSQNKGRTVESISHSGGAQSQCTGEKWTNPFTRWRRNRGHPIEHDSGAAAQTSEADGGQQEESALVSKEEENMNKQEQEPEEMKEKRTSRATHTTKIRKLFAFLSFFGQGCALLAVARTHDHVTCVALICIGVGFQGLHSCGTLSAYLDMSPCSKHSKGFAGKKTLTPLSHSANPLRDDPKKKPNPPRKGLFEGT
jgi:hypothetical protein